MNSEGFYRCASAGLEERRGRESAFEKVDFRRLDRSGARSARPSAIKTCSSGSVDLLKAVRRVLALPRAKRVCVLPVPAFLVRLPASRRLTSHYSARRDLSLCFFLLLRSLVLLAPSPASSMSATLTLVTSDDPPVRLEATRLVLAAGSKVFADMFELPQLEARRKEAEIGCEEGCVVLAEPEKVIVALITMFEGKAVGELDRKTWEALAQAGDKYDSPVVKQYIERRVWCVRSSLFLRLAAFSADRRCRACRELEAKDTLALHSYTLATYCGSDELLERTALRAVDSVRNISDDCGTSHEWQRRLARRTSSSFDARRTSS